MAKRILLVDDSSDILTALEFRVKNAGYETLSAVNGLEALEMIQKTVPDLVILDVRLPIMFGFEVCKIVKADEKLKGMPIILCTASKEGIQEKAAACGADDYLIKPFNAEELLKKIKRFIG
jgi:CheY-like chemotaxis protein